MTPAWLMAAIAVAGIAAQVVTAFVIIKVSVAVLEERMNGFKQLVVAKLEAQDEHLSATDSEVTRLRNWRHDIIAPMLQTHAAKIQTLEGKRHG